MGDMGGDVRPVQQRQSLIPPTVSSRLIAINRVGPK